MRGQDIDIRLLAIIVFMLLLGLFIYFVMTWTGKVDEPTYLLRIAGGLG